MFGASERASARDAMSKTPLPISARAETIKRSPAVRGTSSSCKNCTLRSVCSVNPDELACSRQMDDLILGYRHVKKGDALYRVGDAFRNLYAVRTGSYKKVTLLADGREQVTGFYVSGELLGADGISTDHYASDVIALEDSSVCVMPFDLLELLSREVKAVQHNVFRMLSADLVRESNALMLLGTMTADERVAAFLLDLSRRWQARSYSPNAFVLRMTREETGSFLGLKLETVSRTLSRFQKQGLIKVHGKEVEILDLDGLSDVARRSV
ncbi:helix-turn-helix domain-containing protein [Trinickia sp. Y13]|jgi:CRP/FNR family transcriptional regulator|uniref:helix-turn-helix domain-containing protein n=1 Tax=Trinickia sp. Y13 TaxID=2917807 RepID=UPI0024058D2C|nr:helix-turn-helix domain-containing protein [Trinickia sp. Y13]MDG0023824.1 helix-turn-helix domain-containing protein [Trinickia sp. Y13]